MKRKQLHPFYALPILFAFMISAGQSHAQFRPLPENAPFLKSKETQVITSGHTLPLIDDAKPLSGEARPLGCDTNGSVLNIAVCENSYIHNGRTYTASDTFREKYTNVEGCDSTVYVNLGLMDLPVIAVEKCIMSTSLTYKSYQWLLNSIPIPGATGSYYEGTEKGSYSVAVVNWNNCKDTSGGYTCYPTDTSDGGGNGVGSTEPTLKNEIKIFPNPTSGALTLYSPVPVTLRILSIDGRVHPIKAGAPYFSLASLEKGLYFIEIRDLNLNQNLIKVERVVRD